MSFVSLGGSESGNPTFFELVAAERLMPSLKAAATYSFSVLGQSRPWCYRLLGYEDELFAVVAMFLDHGSLSTSGGTFAESLYSLRRTTRPGTRGGSGNDATARQGEAAPGPMLTRRQQHLALALSVLLPYLNAKVQALFERHRPPMLPGFADFHVRQAAATAQQQQEQLSVGGVAVGPLAAGSSSLVQRGRQCAVWLRAVLLRAFIKAYPFVHAGQEGSKFLLQLLYLLDATPYYSPALWLLGQRVVRVSGPELSEVARRQARQREAALERARGATTLLGRLIRQGYLRASYLFTDHTRNALILSVFAFKALEWWYTSAEGKLASQEVLPPPPPPPAPLLHPQGVGLPEDPTVCGVCRQTRTNPAVMEVSGYAFCYPCAYRYVQEHGCCPVTRRPASVENVRRIYTSG